MPPSSSIPPISSSSIRLPSSSYQSSLTSSSSAPDVPPVLPSVLGAFSVLGALVSTMPNPSPSSSMSPPVADSG